MTSEERKVAGKATAEGNPAGLRFLLDGEVVELGEVEPERTVLQFLREDCRRTGTKEGCAEGDCGACTVVVADIAADGKRLRARAVNSCIQFLPTLDGKELITVESLRGPDGTLHPVQQAMVDCHGSQCGFCTPGFVMSLFALYKENPAPSRREIDDALAGNLCRCTGYRPIVSAAEQMYRLAGTTGPKQRWIDAPAGDADTSRDEQDRVEALRRLERSESLAAGKDGRRFFAPRHVGELAQRVLECPDATIVAGGTDVGLWVTKQLQRLDTVIYTGAVSELRRIEVRDDGLEIGAAVTLTDALPAIVGHYPELTELLMRFASPPIRNAGTLGGNVVNGSPIGDTMPALLALDAGLLLRRGNDTRELPVSKFYLGYRRTALEAGEFLEAVRIPAKRPGALIASYKVSKRFDQDISAVCAAYRVELDGSRVATARVAYGGMAETPRRARHCEEALADGGWSEGALQRAAEALAHDFEPISDMRASAAYRLRVAQNLLRRFWLETSGATVTERVYGYGRQKLA